jgi:hypothetical protein
VRHAIFHGLTNPLAKISQAGLHFLHRDCFDQLELNNVFATGCKPKDARGKQPFRVCDDKDM